MERRITDSDFKRHQKIVASRALVGVPEGTPGKILYVAGYTWVRYRVLFDNGVERGNLDGQVLMDRHEWEERRREAERAERRLEQERLAEELRSKVVAGPVGH
jgi:hypothetical protein